MSPRNINIILAGVLICVTVCFVAHVENHKREEPAATIKAEPTTVYIYVDKVEHYGDHAEVNSRNEIRDATATRTLWEVAE